MTEEDLRTLEAIAALAVVACRNAEAYQRARVAAATDSLTGLMNHGALHLRAREEISRARRIGTPLACLLLDLDDFKTVNDERGHQAGDEQLRAVAAALRSELRDHDVGARYGGDEFVVLLPDADPAGSHVVAERLAAAVPKRCSIGGAQWGEPLSADELLDRADRALLLAKRTGKERVAFAGADLEQELELVEARAGSTDATMREFWEMVAASESSRQTLLTLPSFVRRTIGAEEVALFELDGDGALVRAAGASALDRQQPTAFDVERVPATSTLRERLALGAISRPTLAGMLAAIGAEELPEARGAPAGAYAVVPLLSAGRPHGLIAVRTRRELSTERLRLLELLSRQTMAVFTAQPASGSPAAVQALAAAIEARDNYTHEHSEQVVSLATDVAKLLGLPPAELDAVRHGALLHGVGKLAIPNEILHKPGPLTEAEWRRDGRAPRDRRADPPPHAAARPPRPDRAPRARALGRQRLPRRPRRHRDPDRVPDHPRLRRLQRDDHHAALPRGDVARGRGRRAARQVRHAVRPAGRRRAPDAAARACAAYFGGFGVVISVAL